jgi:hypothetical protein
VHLRGAIEEARMATTITIEAVRAWERRWSTIAYIRHVVAEQRRTRRILAALEALDVAATATRH